MDARSKRRIEQLIKIKISSLLLKGLKDPRLEAFITIMEVKLSNDGKSATVVVSVIGSDREKRLVLRGLDSAGKYIQWRLGREMRLKYMPHLIFKLDETMEERVKFVHRLSEMQKADESNNIQSSEE